MNITEPIPGRGHMSVDEEQFAPERSDLHITSAEDVKLYMSWYNALIVKRIQRVNFDWTSIHSIRQAVKPILIGDDFARYDS